MENNHNQVISISKSYHDSLEEYVKHVAKILPVTIIPQAVVYVLFISLLTYGGRLVVRLLDPANSTIPWGSITIAALILITMLLISLIGFVALYYMVVHREQVSILHAFEHSLKYLWRFIAQAIIVGIITALGTAVGYIFVSGIGLAFGLFSIELLNPVFNVLSLFVPPATSTIAATFFVFAGYSVIDKNHTVREALRHSFRLVNGHFLPTIIRTLLLTAIILCLGYVIQLIPYIGLILSLLTLTPFSVIYIYILYKDLDTLKA